MVEPTRVLSFAEIFGLFAAFFAFVFSGTGGKPPHPPGEPPQVPPPLPSTLPPPAEPPQVPPSEPPRMSEPPPAAPSDPPFDVRSVVALASHFPLLLQWLRTLRVPERDCQDVAQEVLISALRRWAVLVTLPGVSEAAGRRRWLFGVTANKASEYRRQGERSRGRLTDPLETAARIPSGEPSAEELLLRLAEADEAAAEVDLEALRAATTPERWSAFYAHDVEGLPMSAIAAAHGVPLGTIATRIRLAKEDLRAAILRARAQREGEERRSRLKKK